VPAATRRSRSSVAIPPTLLALAMVAIVAAGCGGGDNPSATTPDASKSTKNDSAGSDQAASGDKPKIYMIGSVANNTFWAAVKRGFEDGGREFGMDAVYSAPDEHSASKTIPLIRSAIAADPAGIAINYQDKSLREPVLAALDAGINVVLFNNRLFQAVPGQPDTETTDAEITSLAYSGEDTEANARALATEYAKHLEPGATVVIADPVPGVLTLALRRRGIESVLESEGFKTAYLPAALDEGKNYSTIGSYVQGHDDVGGIVGLGGPTANPAARYVKKNGLDIAVAGFDVDAATAAAIKDGSMVAATDQQPYLQGYLSAMNLNVMLTKHLFPVTVNTGSYIVTKDNLASVERALEAGTG
jgi:simple sugar transport system substrate-binding protein